MKIVIIGGGWVGCHLAYKLKNEHNITIYEKNDNLFNETSLNNQNRLHYGYHYSRNHKTRELCKNTFNDFINDYGFLIEDVKNNIYCVPKKNSLIDYNTYLKIFQDFEYSVFNNLSEHMEGCISTQEKYINFKKAYDFFNNELSNLFVKKNITHDEIINLKNSFDIVINATNNHIKDFSFNESFYELTISFLYEKISETNFGALTMVDGQLFSIYPYEDNIYTVTDVEHTPIKKFKNINDLNEFKNNNYLDLINKKRILIENKICEYFPNFLKEFKYYSYFISTKSKIESASDERYPIITKQDNLINCFTGKIQGIYIIEKFINNEINNW